MNEMAATEPTQGAPDNTSNELSRDDEIVRLLQLSKLTIDQSPVTTVLYVHVTKLNLSDCGLSNLPDRLPSDLPNLSILFLSNNRFTEMPAVIGACPQLQMVAFKHNEMQRIHPDALQAQLRWLILTDNVLTALPDTMGRCTRLQKCMLSGNQLTCLPDTMANCECLELIRLASNRLRVPPICLMKLPNLRWIGLSDNPFLLQSDTPDFTATTTTILPSLNIASDSGEVLGQGAGGVTRKVPYEGTVVAVKTTVPGQAMTSDGTPAHERFMATLTATLSCNALIRVLGQTSDGCGLVMEYLHNYAALAGPPSMESCSRDLYDADWRINVDDAHVMVTQLLHAMVQLHSILHVCHGDFYAHNILVQRDQVTNVRLSDFGAAFVYNNDKGFGAWLQKVELRAFATLVEELNVRLDESGGPADELLTELARQCCTLPTFDSVHMWWQQQRLQDMASSFGVDNEEKR